MYEFIPQLIELRKRLFKALIAFLIIFSLFFYFDHALYTIIAKPLLALLPKGSTLIATEITSSFSVPMKLAYISALFLTMPYLLYHLWSFISPALYAREKRFFFPVLFFSILLFYLGILFSFFVICPMALQFFLSVTPKEVLFLADIRHYLDFVLSLLMAGGLAFQVPVITLLVIQWGLVSAKQLGYLRPYIIVAAFVLGMLLTPPDVVSQILLALPMWGLFEVGLVVAKFLESSNLHLEHSKLR